jgi:DNA-directed RNA polymerase alpha subunit
VGVFNTTIKTPMNKKELLLKIKEEIFPILMREQKLLLSIDLVNSVAVEDPDRHWDYLSNQFLGVRALNVLKSLNIKTLRDLNETTTTELLNAKNCGRKTLNEIMKFLAAEGFYLKDREEEIKLMLKDKPEVELNFFHKSIRELFHFTTGKEKVS